MPIDRRTLIGAAAGLAVTGAARAQTGQTPTAPPPPIGWPPADHFPLWPTLPPGAPSPLPTPRLERNGYQGAELWLRGTDRPYVAVFRPERPDGRAVLSIPGGGYQFVSASNEGIDVAAALNPHGITVFVLVYRLPGEGWAHRADVPLQDGQRAMRLIRANASKWGIDPAKLGICGFSAGGHLAGMLAVGHEDSVYTPVDAADRLPARPAFAGLVYPVTSFVSHGFTPDRGAALWGDAPDAATVARNTPLARITAATPPISLAHAVDDPVVPIAQSLGAVEACHAAGVPVEAHLFEKGGHGFGAFHLAAGATGLAWPDLFDRWNRLHA